MFRNILFCQSTIKQKIILYNNSLLTPPFNTNPEFGTRKNKQTKGCETKVNLFGMVKMHIVVWISMQLEECQSSNCFVKRFIMSGKHICIINCKYSLPIFKQNRKLCQLWYNPFLELRLLSPKNAFTNARGLKKPPPGPLNQLSPNALFSVILAAASCSTWTPD